MILLFTDFGAAGPYTGQMEAVLCQLAPSTPVISLLSDAPIADPVASSYLLAALRGSFPEGSIFLSVVDPGVGGMRKPVVLSADGQYFVGPDNGLFNTVAVHSAHTCWWEIVWRPEVCSTSFHGRDLFAPVAAALAEKKADEMLSKFSQRDLGQWSPDLMEIIYFDHYGNAMTGIRYIDALSAKQLQVNGLSIVQAKTFSAVAKGDFFWYKNSIGLIEIAVNQGRAKDHLNLLPGSAVRFS